MGMTVHFVLIGQWFPYAFYLSVMSVKKVLNPDKIYVWTTDFLKGNKWWDLTEPIVDRQLVKIPELSFPNNWAQYQIGTISSNCIRLEKLYEYGGVYLDFDTFTIKDFSELLEGYEVVIPRNLDCKISDYNNNVIMATPKSEIIKKAINNTREWRKSGILPFIDTVRVPYRHLDTGPVNISWIADNIKPNRIRKCPHQFFQYPNPVMVMNPGKHAKLIYVMHFGASTHGKMINSITPEWIEKSESLYAKAVKRILTDKEWRKGD